MKKLLSLITLLACAGSLYAAEAGTLTPSRVGFESSEGYAADTVISNTLQETGNTTGFYQWWSAGSDEGETGTIKLYDVAVENPSGGEEGEGGEAAPASETEAGLPRYDYGTQNVGTFVNLGPGNQYLNVETTTGKPLYRTLATWNNNFLWVKTEESGEKTYWTDDGDPAVEEQGTVWQKEYQVTNITNIAGVEIGSEGKVIDTLVQFTASETAPELADGDKLVVWLKQQTEDDKPADWQDEKKVGTKYIYTWTDENEVIQTREFVVEPNAEPTAEQKADIPEEALLTTEDVKQANVWPCYTNLMVTAGKLASGGTVTRETFTIDANKDVLPDTWYRLTIRAIENVTTYTGKQSGFAIYLDGVAVTCLDDDYQAKLLNGFDVEKLSSTAKDLYNNKQLFISAVSSASGASVLTAVGFDGTGKIDDLTINTVAAGPQFAMGTRLFKVEWDNGLTGFTIVAKGSDGNEIENSETQFSNEGGAAGATEFVFADGATTYEIKALTFASGSTLSEVTATGAEATANSGTGVYSFTNLQFAPVVKIDVATTLATVGGKEYSSFEDAIAAAKGGKTLYLAADVTLDGTSICAGDGENLVIDLQGHDILYANPQYDNDKGNPFPLFYVTTGKLTILDSFGGGVIGWATQNDKENGLYLVDGVNYNEQLEDGTYVGSVIVGNQTDKGATFAGGVNTLTAIWSGKFDFAENANRIDEEDVELPWADWTFYEELAVVDSSVLSQSEEKNEEGVPLYWVVTQSAGGEDPDDPDPTEEYTITISGVDAANAAVTVDDVEYSADATYKYTGTPVVIVATANDGYTYAGATAEQGWTIDGTTATYTVSDITADVTVNVPAAVKTASEGPTKWEEVTKDMEVSQVVDSASKDAFTGSGVTARDIADWAVTHEVEFSANGISVTPEALMLNCPNTAKDIADAKEAFKVDEDIFKDIMENLGNLGAVDLREIEAQYPYAEIALEEVPLAGASENAKFFKLKMTLK